MSKFTDLANLLEKSAAALREADAALSAGVHLHDKKLSNLKESHLGEVLKRGG